LSPAPKNKRNLLVLFVFSFICKTRLEQDGFAFAKWQPFSERLSSPRSCHKR